MNEFWDRVDFQSDPYNDCWLWTGAVSSGRYGQFKGEKAHRFAWSLINGTIPDGIFVLHKCDVTLCVRPSHLFLGTQKDNIHDCELKGRSVHPRGDENGRATMTEETARYIKSQLTGKYGEVKKFSDEFGVSTTAISKLKRGVTWSWL